MHNVNLQICTMPSMRKYRSLVIFTTGVVTDFLIKMGTRNFTNTLSFTDCP